MLAAQIYIWLQQFEREHKSAADGIDGALAATRAAGFRRIELTAGLFGEDIRSRTFAALEKHGLEVPIVYSGGMMHEEMAAAKTVEAMVKLADVVKRAGARILNFNPNPKPGGVPKTDEELATQAHNVKRLAESLASRRFQLILHHHNPEMADGAREWRHLLRNTEVPLCIDVHWMYRGRQDALALLEEAGKRVRSLHLRNSTAGVWNETFSDGDLDYRKIAAYLKQAAWAGYLVVELAYEEKTRITRPLEDDLRISREYAEKVFGIQA